jgi:hypothetical protein
MEVLGRSPSFDFKQVLESASFQVFTSLAEEEDLVKRRGRNPQKKSFMPSKVGGFLSCKMHGGARRTHLPLPTATKLLRIHLITSTHGGCWLHQELQFSLPPYPIPDFHRSATTLIQSQQQQQQQHCVGTLRLR